MWHLAELNVARLTHPLDAPESAEFVAALGPINDLAEASVGFVWRLKDDGGQSSSYVEVPGNDDPNIIVNYSIWADLESLRKYVTKSGHSAYLRRRKEWFDSSTQPGTVCWWIREGERPPLSEALQRLEQLRASGPSAAGWPLQKPFPVPG